jgi:hypothetical protein
MAIDYTKVALLARHADELSSLQSSAVQELLTPASVKPNVVGVGLGVKWTGGQPTGEPALLVLVSHKVELSTLKSEHRIPGSFKDVLTDVLAIGHPIAGGNTGVGSQALTTRIRPVRGGYSVGHRDITAGTIAAGVYDILPGTTISPPTFGAGIPQHYYLLSNNHILANSNAAAIGDPILQPGPYDGGQLPDDQIAVLSRFIPISFAPEVPLVEHNNIVDAAVAEVSCADIDRELYWIGRIRGWRRRTNVNVGLVIQKIGRSSCYSVGRVTAINATIDIGYGGGKFARFHDQMLTTPMSSPGDSGSLITTLDGIAVGLLCAGSPAATIANQIENVRSLLWVEIGEQIL